MGQRARIKKNGKSKGVAIRKTSLNSQNNTITVGNKTIKGGSNKGNGKKVKKKRKKKN